jgi:hypothetical protein
MLDSGLNYEGPTVFYRARSERRVYGTDLAIALAAMTGAALFFYFRRDPVSRLMLIAILVVIVFLGLRTMRALLRSRSGWEVRIAGDRLYVRRPDSETEQSVELSEVEHVMLTGPGAGNNRHTQMFLLLRDSRSWQVPGELQHPRRPLVRAILRAAPHATRVTKEQMPERDPLHAPAPRGP